MISYDFKQEAKTVDIYLYGDITTEPWLPGEFSAATFEEAMHAVDDPAVINIHVNSYGGSVSEAWAMYNALKASPAVVNTYADGFVASAAIYPYIAGRNRFASELSAFFFHNVLGGGYGYADDLRKTADDLELMTKRGAAAIAAETGATEADVLELFGMETWITPADAKSRGFVTEIIPATQAAMQQSAKRIAMDMLTKPKEQKEESHKNEPPCGLFNNFFKRKEERK